MRERPDLVLVRGAGLLGTAWGVLLLTRGREIWTRVDGSAPGQVDDVAISLLGARHLAQGAVQLTAPTHFQRTLVAVDVIHTATMLVLAAADRGRRRPALLTAGVAAASAAATVAARAARAAR